MSDEPPTNGTVTPVTPKNLALTEYTAAPTPPSERGDDKSKMLGMPPNWGIPEAFLLPNGYPDVR